MREQEDRPYEVTWEVATRQEISEGNTTVWAPTEEAAERNFENQYPKRIVLDVRRLYGLYDR